MIELTEAIPFAKTANNFLSGLRVKSVEVLNTPHKFAWINHDANDYQNLLTNHVINEVKASSHYLRIIFDNGIELALAEDVNINYCINKGTVEKSQLRLDFTNGFSLLINIKLYGFLLLGSKEELMNSQPYYKKAVQGISPLDEKFTYDYFKERTYLDSKKGTVKQALATEQHIPGLGNGLLQDILFQAKFNPKYKLSTMTENDKWVLYQAVKDKILEIVSKGGRNQQTDLLGNSGGYETLMISSRDFCPKCSTKLIKEAYLGGKVIYCPSCQK